ncbi:MAG: four helix bundle protein [Flavobacteriaceae bacterium]|nr:four helix bundle protein [Flavobacteriaceae bacterium]
MSEIRSFEDLECWKKGRVLRKKISKLIKTFPSFEKFELVSQMRRASRSVTHNISEGYGRFYFRENAQFCRIARGSLYEIIDQLITANDDEYINDEEFLKLKSITNECIIILNGYIKYLIKNANNK